MEKLRPFIAATIFIVGTCWAISDFISYSGIFASLAVFLGSTALALGISPGRESLPIATELGGIFALFFAVGSWLLHAPAFDIDKLKSENNISHAIMENINTNLIPQNQWEKLLRSCTLQSTADQISTVIQAQEIENPEEVAFTKRATGNNYQPPKDKCIDEVNKINKEYPDFFISVKKDIEKINKKKYRISF
ncbi:hypothetical protein [Gluconobacter wancherniae]|uniref:Uncharacterized protein n=1 Tax=Gluconobacter wancherniae NBRC 103581 TaxID=656744 RepID=A0A511AYW2_9PROT|nr:hypothetical protein [Gluconobacter wancherniae]MBF0853528.1 hypothetical protein [Gluconobacter wancherniae]GBD55728.1 hypothetical protein NBRC103581_00295 [Gluconobacter wancherniae NBRC 103581]GBR66240.1 hypothetical protein AA103581_2249 [Gluconobacter wancherniae NBRC 103581]GEK93366.1 hypothetical protein GWA01_11360 [Gluconobacter wancherniae NBRC 103581]